MSFLGTAVNRLDSLRGGRSGFIGQLDPDGLAIPAGFISTTMLADGAVTNAKLAANSVDTANIINGAVTNAKLAANSVTSDKILDGTILPADLAATGVAPGTYTSVTVNAGGQVTAGTNPSAGVAPSTLYAGNFYHAFAPTDNQVSVTPFVWGNGLINGGIVTFSLSVLTVNLSLSTADKVVAVNFSSTGASVGNTVTFGLEMQIDAGGYVEVDRCITQVTSGSNTSNISFHQFCLQGHIYDFRIALTVANAGMYTLMAGAPQLFKVMVVS